MLKLIKENKIVKNAFWFGKRAFVFYVLLFFVVSFFGNKQEALFKAKVASVDRLNPGSFKYLMDFSSGEAEPQKDLFQDYLHYYRKVAEYIPNRDDAFGLSGFCYYYLGQEYQAKKAYKKALEINKYFFWHYYNLAVIHFKNGQYEEVAALLKKALDIKPKMAVMVMLTSKIYNDIFGSVESLGDKPTESLGEGYADARRMLVLSYYHLKDFENMLQVAEYSFRTKADPTMDFYFYAGLAAYEMKQYGRAIQIFQEMAEKNPLSCEAFHYIGLSARALGREDVARGALRQAERLRKKHTSYERINIEDKIKVQFF